MSIFTLWYLGYGVAASYYIGNLFYCRIYYVKVYTWWKTSARQIQIFAKAKVSLKNYDTIFCGGGAELLRPYITKYTPADVLENAQYTNVNGAYNVCKKMWG